MIFDLAEELPPLTKEEVYQVLANTLDLLSGFSIKKNESRLPETNHCWR
jgi:hypothetical protein